MGLNPIMISLAILSPIWGLLGELGQLMWGLGCSFSLCGVTEMPLVPLCEEGLRCAEVPYSGEPRFNFPEKLPLRGE